MKIIDDDAGNLFRRLISIFEEKIGEPAMPGDERRIALDAHAYCGSVQNAELNEAWRQFFPQFATGDALTAHGTASGISRTEGSPASAVFRLLGSPTEDVPLPADFTLSTGGTVWVPDEEGLIIRAGRSDYVPFTAQDGHPLKASADDQNGLFPGDEATPSDTSVSSSTLSAYTRRAVPNDTDDDETFRVRVLAAKTAPVSANTNAAWERIVRETMPSVSGVRATDDASRPGIVQLWVVTLDRDGLTQGLTQAERETLRSDIMNSIGRPLGDFVEIPQVTVDDVSFQANILCKRGASQSVESSLSAAFASWSRTENAKASSVADLCDFIRLADAIEGVESVHIRQAVWFPSRVSVTAPNFRHDFGAGHAVRWSAESAELTFSEVA